MTIPVSSRSKPPLIVIGGPTASGKTALAIELARRFPVEVVSADSRQVYRRMDIGTAKPTLEEQRQVVHHLIDVVDPHEDFSVAEFVELGRSTVRRILDQGKLPLLVGGTGLYIQALTEGLIPTPASSPELRRELQTREESEGPGTLHALLQQYDPDSAARLAPADQVRIIRALEVYLQSGRTLSSWQREHAFADRPYHRLSLGLQWPREQLYARIDRRAADMLDQGLIEETQALLDHGYSPQLKSMRTLGYRECQGFLSGELSRAETLEQIQQQTRRYAKRQLTWFRHHGEINWFESLADFDKIAKLIDDFFMK